MDIVTPAEFERRMKDILLIDDFEDRHREADKLLSKTLDSLGYGAGAALFDKMVKWYA